MPLARNYRGLGRNKPLTGEGRRQYLFKSAGPEEIPGRRRCAAPVQSASIPAGLLLD